MSPGGTTSRKSLLRPLVERRKRARHHKSKKQLEEKHLWEKVVLKEHARLSLLTISQRIRKGRRSCQQRMENLPLGYSFLRMRKSSTFVDHLKSFRSPGGSLVRERMKGEPTQLSTSTISHKARGR